MVIEIESIWQNLSDDLKRYIRKYVKNDNDAEDILQNVFYKIINNIHNLKDEKKLKAWVYRIAYTTVMEYYRLQQKEVVLETQIMANKILDETGLDMNFNKEIAGCIKPMIGKLPEKYKQAIILTEFEGLTQRELSERLGLSLSATKSRVQRARKMLKHKLYECCQYEFDGLGNIIDYKSKKNTYC